MNDPQGYKRKLEVVKKMFTLRIDNRILNNMRQFMNEQIEDERGLMSKKEFKKMFFTFLGRTAEDNKNLIFKMLIPIIKTIEEDNGEVQEFVSIGKLTNFIDFFNYVPLVISEIKHKNDSSEDLYLYMGRETHKSEITASLTPEEKEQLEKDKSRLITLLALISTKIYERFKNILAAFRYFDSDHMLSLTLNEFAQGIEHLRVKISFENVR